MKKTSIKLLSGLLTVLIISALLPLSIIAKPAFITQTVPDLNEYEKLLALDNLGDSENNIAGSTVTYTPKIYSQVAGDYVTEDGKIITGGSNGWHSYIGKTNLPLDNDSKYIISFEASIAITSFTHISLSFNCPGDLSHLISPNGTAGYTPQCIGFETSSKTVYAGRGMPWLTNAYGGISSLYSGIDFNALNDYVLVIDGTDVSIFINNVFLGKFSVEAETANGDNRYLDTFLGFGFRVRGGSAASFVQDEEWATVKNINIFKGAFDIETISNFTEGDVLIKLDNLGTLNNQSEFDDILLTQRANQNCAADGSGCYLTPPVDATPNYAWTMMGIDTSLPLNADSKYTIEFYMQKYQTANLGFCFVGTANNAATGFYYYPNSINTVYGYSSGAYNTSNPGFTGVFTSKADANGWTRYVIEIDGYTGKTYIGGTFAAEFDFTNRNPGSSAAIPDTHYSSDTLILGLKAYVDAAAFALNDRTQPFAGVKDITVYAGNIATLNNISFELSDGTVLHSENRPPEYIIESFPAIAAEEGKIPVWFYKNTNVVVTSPYAVVEDVTIECRMLDENTTQLAALQYTAASSGKQNVRFIATIHTLNASEVGFEIEAYYKNGTAIEKKSYTESITHVYSSISATVNGTVQSETANSLGGTYLFALSIEKVDTTVGQIDFYAKSYIITNGVKTYSETIIITMKDGLINTSLTTLPKA